jgi:hypothetical protein
MDNSPDAVNYGVMTVAMKMRGERTAGRLAHRIAHPTDALPFVVTRLPERCR